MKNRELERLLDRARCEIETLDFEDCITLIEKDEIPMEMVAMLMDRMESLDESRFLEYAENF